MEKKNQKLLRKGETEQLDEHENFKIIDESNIPFINDIQSKEDIAFFVDLLDTYIEDLPKGFASLKIGMENNDSKEVQFFAHKLKGGIVTLGIEPLAKVCLDLEIVAKENCLDDEAQNNFIIIENDLKILIKELNLIKEKYSKLNK